MGNNGGLIKLRFKIVHQQINQENTEYLYIFISTISFARYSYNNNNKIKDYNLKSL